MQWNEYQHAWIVSEFYIQLTGRYGENGKQAFIQASQTYGEQRGKRMALRALRDKKELDFNAYFAYGEYAATPEFFDVNMWCEKGVVNEKVTRCPWADVFAKRNVKDCGVVYCKEIDKAIVRGFNPELDMKTASTQHMESCCRFYFYHENVTEDTLEEKEAENAKMPLSYHCVHVWHVFDTVVQGIYGAEGKEISDKVLKSLENEFGKEASEYIRKKEGTPFDTIISSGEWEGEPCR
jgi:hypothetical protein